MEELRDEILVVILLIIILSKKWIKYTANVLGYSVLVLSSIEYMFELEYSLIGAIWISIVVGFIQTALYLRKKIS